MLDFTDHRHDPAAWAASLNISQEAVELYHQSDVIDLHIDSFIWDRVFGYDLRKRHGHGLLGARFYSQVDFPRVLEAGLSGATWVITTNPLRSAAGRAETFAENLARYKERFASASDQFAIVGNIADYRRARAEQKHAVFVGIQGGNAVDDGSAVDTLDPEIILRVTLVHLSSSTLGVTSSPMKLGADTGLTNRGREFVERLNSKKIFVDLAHISKQGFADVIEIHDPSQPLLVTHTGVSGVFNHWRNLDDNQLRAIADTGGTVGVMYQSSFLGDRYLGGTLESITDHLEHIVNVVGDDHASLGSDWDGAILPPRDMPTCLELPRLVESMLRRGWSDARIQKILGGNFLRVVEQLRG